MKELNRFKIPILYVEEKICQDFNETVFVGEEHQQGPGNINKLDDLTIEKVSALVNTGNENGVANHSTLRTNRYNILINNELKCNDDE